MTLDPRCCGSGTCIVDPAGRCWCGQQWDGEKMANTAPAVPTTSTSPTSPTAPEPPAPLAVAVRPALRTGVGRRRLALGFVVTALSALAMPLASHAAAVAERDARAVRAVIEAQLQAFTGGDAERAFSYASASIRTQFVDAANFMSMVLAGYPMLVQPAASSFFVPEWAGGAVLQRVQLRDRAGVLWRATYQVQPQTDATWRINGCVVVPDSGKSST